MSGASGKVRQRPIVGILVPLQAVRNLQPMVCRINFMDGITKAISLEPYEIVVDVLRKVQQKIDLQNLHGWALYEVRAKQIPSFMFCVFLRNRTVFCVN